LPITAESAFSAGRRVYIVLGSLLGGGLLTLALSWLFVTLGAARARSVAIAGLLLVGAGALLVVLAALTWSGCGTRFVV
jgi:hypothetical protein